MCIKEDKAEEKKQKIRQQIAVKNMLVCHSRPTQTLLVDRVQKFNALGQNEGGDL